MDGRTVSSHHTVDTSSSHIGAVSVEFFGGSLHGNMVGGMRPAGMAVISIPGTGLLLQVSEGLQQLRIRAVHPRIDYINWQLWAETVVAV